MNKNLSGYKGKMSSDSPCVSDNDWTDSSADDSKYSDSESSVPEWDSDVCDDGELVYIKTKAADASTGTTKTPLLENCEAFKLRNEFKRSSTRRSSKGRIFKVLRAHKSKNTDKSDNSKRKDVQPTVSLTNKKDENIVIQVSRSMIYTSEKNCQIEKLFGITLKSHTDGKTLVIEDFLNESKPIYSLKVKKGYYLTKINGIDVNSYNLNSVLHRVSEDIGNPKLTFRKPDEDHCINLERLLTAKHITENTTQIIKDYLFSVIYICCNDIEYNSNDDKGVLYCFPRPYNQNFLYNTRGAYVTLNHLAPKALGTGEPYCSTVLFNNNLVNITYASHDNDLLLIAFPNKQLDVFNAKRIVRDVIRVIEFLYSSLKACFTKPNNVDKLDGLFSRIFVSIIYDSLLKGDREVVEKGVQLEDVFGAHSIILPLEVRVQIDDALTELEAADYREWTDDVENFQRLYTVIGTCLYYSGYLLSTHLQDQDLKEINAFLKLNCVLKLSSEKEIEKLVIWKEVFINEHRTLNKIELNDHRIPEGRWFLLVVGKGNFILATLMEAGGCTEDIIYLSLIWWLLNSTYSTLKSIAI